MYQLYEWQVIPYPCKHVSDNSPEVRSFMPFVRRQLTLPVQRTSRVGGQFVTGVELNLDSYLCSPGSGRMCSHP